MWTETDCVCRETNWQIKLAHKITFIWTRWQLTAAVEVWCDVWTPPPKKWGTWRWVEQGGLGSLVPISPDRRKWRRSSSGLELLNVAIISNQFKCKFRFLLVVGKKKKPLHFKKTKVAVEHLVVAEASWGSPSSWQHSHMFIISAENTLPANLIHSIF